MRSADNRRGYEEGYRQALKDMLAIERSDAQRFRHRRIGGPGSPKPGDLGLPGENCIIPPLRKLLVNR